MSGIAPADQYKANMWASVPSSAGGNPAPFSWDKSAPSNAYQNAPVGPMAQFYNNRNPVDHRGIPDPGVPWVMPGSDQVQNRTWDSPFKNPQIMPTAMSVRHEETMPYTNPWGMIGQMQNPQNRPAVAPWPTF